MELLLGLTLFGSVLWFWLVTLIFLIICFTSDINENGFFAFGTLIVLVLLYYFKGNLDPIMGFFSILHIGVYLGVGLLYSIFRTFFSGRTLGKKIKDYPETKKEVNIPNRSKEGQREDFIDELKGNVFRWWFMWPVSLINWLVTDLIKDTWDYLYSKLKGGFDYILDLGIKSVK